MKEAPDALNRIVDVVLAYRPAKKNKKSKKAKNATRSKKVNAKRRAGA